MAIMAFSLFCWNDEFVVVVMNSYRSGLDLLHGPPAYESDMLPGILSYNENGKCQCLYISAFCGCFRHT